MTKQHGISLLDSRYPFVEQYLINSFLIYFIIEKKECLLIAGPNISGKRTYMRQVAILL